MFCLVTQYTHILQPLFARARSHTRNWTRVARCVCLINATHNFSIMCLSVSLCIIIYIYMYFAPQEVSGSAVALRVCDTTMRLHYIVSKANAVRYNLPIKHMHTQILPDTNTQSTHTCANTRIQAANIALQIGSHFDSMYTSKCRGSRVELVFCCGCCCCSCDYT